MRFLGRILLLGMFVNGILPCLALNVSDYRFHSLPETSYYGGVHSIAKDSLGRIWFSGSDAVYMYDGISFNRCNEKLIAGNPDSYWTFLQVVTAADKSVYIGTNNGLMKYDYAKVNFNRVLDGNISFVAVDDNGVIWMIRNDSIESMCPIDGILKKYPFSETMKVSPSTLSLSCTSGRVYVATGNEIYLLDSVSGQYEKFAELPISESYVRDVIEYEGVSYVLTSQNGIFGFRGGRPIVHYRLPKEYEKSTVAKELYLASGGVLWAATQSGLFLVDISKGQTQMLRTNIYYPYSLPNNSVWTLYPDPDGGVWVGTYGGKLAYVPVSDSGGNWFKATPGGLSHSIVSCFEEDKNGNLWIGTEGGGVNYWDRINNRFIYYTQENNSGVRSNMIKKLHYDDKGNLMMSAFNGGMQVFDKESNRFVDFAAGTEFPSFMSVYDFVRDSSKGYWISDPDSPLRYLNLIRRKVEVRAPDYNGTPLKIRIENMFRDASGALCLVSSKGLYVLDDDGKVTNHHFIPDMPFSKNDLSCYHKSKDGIIWFGTHGGGLNVLTGEGTFDGFCDSNGNGLEGKTIFGILDDEVTGDLWMSTDDGLYVYDKSEDVFRRSTIDSDNLCGAYYVRSCFKTSGGEMLFGGTDGFIMFDPRKIGSNTHKPKPFFVKMTINSKIVEPDSEDSPLSADISTMSSGDSSNNPIRLSHRQTNFEIYFSSDSYQDPDKSYYAYRMRGLSENWNLLPQGQRSVAFFDMHPGNYVFELKAANNDGLWSDEIITLRFRVASHPFLSIWAYFVYIVILVMSVFLLWGYITNRKKFKKELDLKQAELTELYSKKYVAGPSEIVVASMDDELLKKALGYIERNIDNSDYSVEDFVSDMAMGRTVLYQRIHNITGHSIKEFIQDIRLKRSVDLLEESDKTIAEISYMTGFVNPKYFSAMFKKTYGITPSEYRKSRCTK